MRGLSMEVGAQQEMTLLIDGMAASANILLISAIVVDPLKVLRRGAWVTILNLAIADLIASTANFLDVGFTSEFGGFQPVAIRISRFFLLLGIGASFTLLTILTAEAYLVTRYPFKGRFWLTSRKSVLFCTFAWIAALPFGISNVPYLFANDYRKLWTIYVVQIGFLELTILVQIVLKFAIIHVIMKSRQNARQQSRKHKEIAKTIVLLNLILFVTAVPFFVAKQVEFLWELGLIGGKLAIREFSNYYEPIANLNHLANPILYALRLAEYKQTFRVLFKKCKR